MLTIKGGIRPDSHKYTKNIPIGQALSPLQVKIRYYDDDLIVNVGDNVAIGQSLTKKGKAHASINGIINSIADNYVEIKATEGISNQLSFSSFKKKLSNSSQEELLDFIRTKGIFYNDEFLIDKLEKAINKVKILIISCGETIPFSCSRYKVFSENKKEVIYGIKILMKVLGLSKAALLTEALHNRTIQEYKKLIGMQSSIEIFTHGSKYPTEHPIIIKREFIKKHTRRKDNVSADDILMLSCEEAVAVFNCFKSGVPMINRYITIDGDAVSNPQTLDVAIGTPIYSLLEVCEATFTDDCDIILDNPIIGKQISSDGFIQKDTQTILVFNKKNESTKNKSECISCGKCHTVCPQGLYPSILYENDLKNQNCIECGCCSYICPAQIDFSVIYKSGEGIRNVE